VPLPKKVGKVVKAGSTLVNGSLDVQTTTLISENSLAAVANLVERAQASRTRFQDLADRIAAKLLPIALCVSVLAGIVWGVASRYASNESPSDSAVTGITYAIAVMAVSCPCAIGLAVCIISRLLHT
jgi:Cu2+-exporting ATPase